MTARSSRISSKARFAYQTIAGYEAVRQGNCLFAGEHTSIDFQGFMEGGAFSGQRAANEILADLK